MLCVTCEQAPRKKGRRQCGRCAWQSEDRTAARERRKLYKQRLRRRHGCPTREEIRVAAQMRKLLPKLPKSPRKAQPSRFIPTDTTKKPLHRRAQYLVYLAVKTGKIIRPSTCSKCAAQGKIQGSHNDYSRPLDVEWLCARCHNHKDHMNPKVRPTKRSSI